MVRQIFLLVSNRPFSCEQKEETSTGQASKGPGSVPQTLGSGLTVSSMIEGGLKGYSAGKLILPWYTPPAKNNPSKDLFFWASRGWQLFLLLLWTHLKSHYLVGRAS